MAIISISGYAGSGKDTVGKMIQDIKAPGVWHVKKWAGKLKQVASLLTGIPIEKFEDQEFKKTDLGPEWSSLKMRPGKRQDGIFPKKADMFMEPMSVRDMLQKLGTEAMRDGLHTNVWVNALMSGYKPTQARKANSPMPNWIITDTRFPNEADAVRERGGILVKVERPGVKPVNSHPSENALDNYAFDYVIHNDGDINYLEARVKEFLNSSFFAAL